MSGEGGAIAEVLAAHEADVTSYDAGDIQGCRCGWELPTDLANSWDDKWPAYRAHVADHLADLLAAERQRGRAEERAGECRRLAARACRNAEGRTGADADWWNRTAAWLMGHAATADREATR